LLVEIAHRFERIEGRHLVLEYPHPYDLLHHFLPLS
jgi:hypothetical protein